MAAINRASIGLVAFLAIIFATAAFPAAMAQPAEQFAPAPSPTSDGISIFSLYIHTYIHKEPF